MIIALSIIFVGIAGYYFFKEEEEILPPTQNELEEWDNMPLDKAKILKLGSRGPEVMILQKFLGELVADGIFGKLTLARMKEVLNKSEVSLSEININYLIKI